MPPPGGAKKKKKGRAPRHQNSFAFRHNPKSKKTDKILASPNVGVCKRCHEKIEWRKKYRKYKPRTQPGKCNLCTQKNILTSYHTICSKCTGSDKAIAAMENHKGSGGSATTSTATSPSECEPATILVDGNGEEEPAAPCNNNKRSRRWIRVCAICANEPAMSKYSNADVEDEDLIHKLEELEDALEDGINEEGGKMTVRETRGTERKIEKLKEELKERRKKRKSKEEEVEVEEEGVEEEDAVEEEVEENNGEYLDDDDDDVNPVNEVKDDPHWAEEDPFLLATGGKALVGEDYQKMLLAREQQK